LFILGSTGTTLSPASVATAPSLKGHRAKIPEKPFS